MVFQSFNLWSHMTLIENVIEVPVHVLGVKRDEAIADGREPAATASALPTSATSIRPSCPAASSSAARSRGRSPSSRASCCSTSRPRRSIPELVGEVLKVIGDLAREGRTMILVTHEMKFAREVASHVVYLHNGLVEEEGPPEAGLRRAEIRAAETVLRQRRMS